MSALSEEQKRDIRVLQFLSTLYVPGSHNLSRVSSRHAAQFLGMNAYDVEDAYEKLARYKFVTTSGTTTNPGVLPAVTNARLDPDRWVHNRSPLSALYAHYVSNAPSSLRTNYSQRAVMSTGAQPLLLNSLPPSTCSTVVASNFNGVFNPQQTNTFNCPVQQQDSSLVETMLLMSTSADETRLATENLTSFANFRTLLLGAYSHGVSGMPLAEWLDRGPALSSKPLYCLAVSDDAMSDNPEVLTDHVVSGGSTKGPYSAAPFTLSNHDGSTSFLLTPTAPKIGEGTITKVGGVGGDGASYSTLGKSANGTWILHVTGGLPT